ncbi:MAG: DUF4280 domain-containing protein [Myxococcota bacterium]
MPKVVCNGAKLKCSFGASPGSLTVTENQTVNVGTQKVATIRDHKPNVNISDFGMCSSAANPAVIAAQGSPVKCVPPLFLTWLSQAATVNTDGKGKLPLDEASCTFCVYLGMVTITDTNSDEVNVP